MESRGRVVFVGAGPGDPRLLTLRGRDALVACTALVHDAGIAAEMLSLAPSSATRTEIPRVAVVDAAAAEATGAALARAALAGGSVVRLVHDDPLATAGDEEVRAVGKSGVPFEIVPGVHSVTAIAAFGGFPLVRGQDISPSFAVIVATSEVELHDWRKLADATDTLVIVTSAAALRDVIGTVVYHGRSDGTPCALIVSVGTSSQRSVVGSLATLRDGLGTSLRGLAPTAPLHLVIGDVVARHDALAWFENRPLFGKRVLVTRAPEQASTTAQMLTERGARVVLVPTIEIHPAPDPAPLADAIARLAEHASVQAPWDVVAFTSANGVERTWQELHRQQRDLRVLGRSLVAAIGPATAAALEAHGVRADIVAEDFRGEGLASAIRATHRRHVPAAATTDGEATEPAASGPRVLLLRALVAREALPEALREAGCHVDVVAVYETKPASRQAGEELARALDARTIDAVTLTSSSTATNLVALLGPRAADLLAKTRVASIGPITTETALRLGIRVDLTASPFTLPALVCALERSFEAP